MKRIAVIEDDPKRVRALRQKVVGRAEVMWSSTVDGFVQLLSEQPAFDLLVFDHDLGGEQMVESGPGTGYEAAQRIPIKGFPRLLVWSFNPIGAERIALVLYERTIGLKAGHTMTVNAHPFASDGCWAAIERALT